MRPSLDEVIHLNNVAVRHFESSRFGIAKEYFRQAAKVVCSLQSGTTIPESTSIGHNAPIHGGWSKTPVVPAHTNPKSANDIFIFARTLLLERRSNDARWSRLYLSFTLYNLAIAVHVEATMHSRLAIRFKAASKLYQMSYCTLTQIGYVGDNLLLISMFNNTGAIFYSEFARYGDAKQCFLAVSQLLVSREANSMSQFLNNTEVAELIMNLFIREVQCAPVA
jgi:hypothetical protein